ncbi:4Fe-4S dicluster domain-containing protein [Blastopirellula marina]|uniref:Ferredoxin n=1 Tax=Blastopirellula marina TaxID=124 RepID=A0A2S8GNC9_9BACT|nr:4Fe-4S dicluster domain-containing protein [Blastopirellula marina]PQO45928.1 ferredoxin [Blastopirellula marina]
MALKIVDRCVNCHACQMVCPTGSIRKGKNDAHFLINQDTCTECVGSHKVPQCSSICPIECAIEFADGTPVNPFGSLTGLPADKAILV